MQTFENATDTHPDHLLEDRSYAEPAPDQPYAAIDLTINARQIVLDGSGSRPAEGLAYAWSIRESNPAPLEFTGPSAPAGKTLDQGASGQRLELTAPKTDGEYYITLRVSTPDGREDSSTAYFVVEDRQPRLPDSTWENAEWIEKAIVYGLAPRNFQPPGLQGITRQLDDLRDLGINAIWLSPVNETKLGNYGYHVLNYFGLESAYGTKDDFRKLVQEAQSRGIRVLMDFVPNHTSEHHRYFEDTLLRGKESPYWDFYDRDENGAHTNYFYWSYLPNLNFNNPKVVRWIIEAFAYWVREFDVDGFRVDVAWGIRQRNPEFWPACRQALRRIKPDLLLLAEAGARDSYYFSHSFDAAYDWTDELGHGAWERVFEDRSLLHERLTGALTNNGKGFHPDALVFRFLNNNDTGARFITRYGVGMIRVATALLLTLPGLPGLFLGDETGTEFMPYKTRGPLEWDADPHGLRPYHQKLIVLRKQVPALHSRAWRLLDAKPRQKVFAYLRYAGPADAPVLVLLNYFDAPLTAEVDLPGEFAGLFSNRPLRDLLTGQELPPITGQKFACDLPAMSAVLLAPHDIIAS